jgi:uncharacterized UPF0146 family protein
MSRVKESKNVESDFACDPEDVRFGTPKEVAEYRANRLKCGRLIEIGAGVGFQTIAFSKTCEEVIAIELDAKRAAFLSANMKLRGVKNVTVICGDALDPAIIKKVGKADIIFVDTERPESEEQRTLESIIPSIPKIIESYSKMAKGIVIEVPPHLDANLDCEKEYISLNGRLNRLNLYFHGLKKCKKSVVLLPSGARLEGDGKLQPEKKTSSKGFRYIYEMDPALALSGLTSKAAKDMSLISEGKKDYLLAKERSDNQFLKGFRILETCEYLGTVTALKRLGCGKTIIRYSVDPAEYWGERKKYERMLTGELTCHLFRFGEEYVVCLPLGI